MKIGKECQKKKNGEYLLFWGDKFLVIPILNWKHMLCLPNATLSNDGSVPGTTLWFRKITYLPPKIKFLRKIIWKFQADKIFSIFCFLVL